MIKKIVFCLAVLTLTGCASLTIDKIVDFNPTDDICIINNPSVKKAFVDAYKVSIEKLGYEVSIKQSDENACRITSTYTASYGMHWGVYLARADLKIFRNNKLIGRAQYKAPRAALSKHGRVSGKIDKLVKGLFLK